jgi:hypothetical protein
VQKNIANAAADPLGKKGFRAFDIFLTMNSSKPATEANCRRPSIHARLTAPRSRFDTALRRTSQGTIPARRGDIRTSARLKVLTNPHRGVKRSAHKGCGCGPSI